MLTLIVCVIVCAPTGCGDSKKREEGRAQLAQRVAKQLGAAKAKADAYDFDGANVILRNLPEEVDTSPFADVATYDKLTADIQAVRRTVSDQESDYRKKMRAGWKVTGGELVSPKDQPRALARRKHQEEAERARREADKAPVAAEAKARDEALAEQRRREEAKPHRRAAEDARPAGKAKARQEAIGESIESPVTLKVGDGELRVRFQFATLYIPANIPKGDDVLVHFSRTKQCAYSRFFFVGYRPSVGEQHRKATEGFFRVNGKAEKLECRSSNEAVLHIVRYDDEEGLCVEALAPGRANIVLSLAGRGVELPFEVVQIPIRTGDFHIEEYRGGPSHTREDVIEMLGLPDDRKETLVAWPDSVFYAGQHFSPPPGSSWRIQRWEYDKYPGAEIVFIGNSAAYYARSAQTFEIADPP